MERKIYNILFEETEESREEAPESKVSVGNSKRISSKPLDSVDDQIDALILRYENSSIKQETIQDDLMESSLNYKNLKFLLEQEEELPSEETPETAPSAEAQPPAPEPEGSEQVDVDQMGEQLVPNLDIDAFAMRTVRLITNYKNLLRVEEAIVNRVKNFLDENYGDPFVSEYLDILDRQHGISVGEFGKRQEVTDDNYAVGAFAGGTGGGGA